MSTERRLRIAAFGFRSFPPREGSAGADKFALELLPRLARRGHEVTAYNRIYSGQDSERDAEIDGVMTRSFHTVHRAGFDTLVHSTRVTYDIIRNNRADIVHIQNGGNSIFGAILRAFGKKTYLSQDGLDWERDKWPWYAKVYLWLSAMLTARVHNAVIFDNVYAQEDFQARFKRRYHFIPFGADVQLSNEPGAEDILHRLGVTPGEYFLFVGRFIPDKGLHWLIPGFEGLESTKKLLIVGGPPNPSSYDQEIRKTNDPRIIFAGFLYGSDVHTLMKNAFAYTQPSAIEGLSPVILEAAYLGAPIICSDIPQNRYGIGDFGTYFKPGDIADITAKLRWAEQHQAELSAQGMAGSEYVARRFSWDAVVDEHLAVFAGE